MKRIILAIAAMTIPALMHATPDSTSLANVQLAVAVQDSGVSFGTDAGTTTYPNAGMNTTPTKNIGTDSNAVDPNAPIAKPGQAPAFNPAPAFAPAPAYTPPASQNGTTNTNP
ncbi:hypothetical protein BN59_01325 [Legionella massiliensis]|uniref:Uncharacterized protein n=1 Tax=Legionella massiliensis TaxID=1034943 RepID=A0A078KVN7_9GAMM|nr:hypothetical protein [Legionella massiliensis]CDZ77046.1 hypothetical protein BN59_01325 [Legionella massiliensis]CEE12784.1 hypothetical protein BN1094_01325 [Legionella massiliensis]